MEKSLYTEWEIAEENYLTPRLLEEFLFISFLFRIRDPRMPSMQVCVLHHFSHIWLFATAWAVACQAPLSVGLSQARALEWVTMPSPRDLPDPGIQPASLRSPARFFTTSTSWEAQDSFHSHFQNPRASAFFSPISHVFLWTGVIC